MLNPGLTIVYTALHLKLLPLGSPCLHSSEHQGWSVPWVRVGALPLPPRTLSAPGFLDSLTLKFCISDILGSSDSTGLWSLVLLPQKSPGSFHSF